MFTFSNALVSCIFSEAAKNPQIVIAHMHILMSLGHCILLIGHKNTILYKENLYYMTKNHTTGPKITLNLLELHCRVPSKKFERKMRCQAEAPPIMVVQSCCLREGLGGNLSEQH